MEGAQKWLSMFARDGSCKVEVDSYEDKSTRYVQGG